MCKISWTSLKPFCDYSRRIYRHFSVKPKESFSAKTSTVLPWMVSCYFEGFQQLRVISTGCGIKTNGLDAVGPNDWFTSHRQGYVRVAYVSYYEQCSAGNACRRLNYGAICFCYSTELSNDTSKYCIGTRTYRQCTNWSVNFPKCSTKTIMERTAVKKIAIVWRRSSVR